MKRFSVSWEGTGTGLITDTLSFLSFCWASRECLGGSILGEGCVFALGASRAGWAQRGLKCKVTWVSAKFSVLETPQMEWSRALKLP